MSWAENVMTTLREKLKVQATDSMLTRKPYQIRRKASTSAIWKQPFTAPACLCPDHDFFAEETGRNYSYLLRSPAQGRMPKVQIGKSTQALQKELL